MTQQHRSRQQVILVIAALACASLLAGCFDVSDGGASSSAVTGDVWIDRATDLMWQARTESGPVAWVEAGDYCDGLVLRGYNDWRLPTISELRTLVQGCPETVTGGACPVSDECDEGSCQDDTCYVCRFGDGPAGGCFGPPELDGVCGYEWSATPVSDLGDRAWAIGFTSGFIYKPRVYYAFGARCVRPAGKSAS